VAATLTVGAAARQSVGRWSGGSRRDGLASTTRTTCSTAGPRVKSAIGSATSTFVDQLLAVEAFRLPKAP